VVLPGGGYGGLATHEGAGYAEWLADHGIAAFVVKYRLGSAGYRHPVMLNDASRAIRIVRSRAAEWNLDPKRVGIMGSSAGGHLASTVSTHFDAGNAEAADPIEKESSRPDISILCYPVVTMLEFTHKGSRRNLLGEQPSQELMENLSTQRQVTDKTPPTFIFHTWDAPSRTGRKCASIRSGPPKSGRGVRDAHLSTRLAWNRYGQTETTRHPWGFTGRMARFTKVPAKTSARSGSGSHTGSRNEPETLTGTGGRESNKAAQTARQVVRRKMNALTGRNSASCQGFLFSPGTSATALKNPSDSGNQTADSWKLRFAEE